MDPKAQNVIDTCQNDWQANKADCSGFVKAVCAGLGVAMSAGMADDIVAWFRTAANGWEQLTDVTDGAGNLVTPKEQMAKDRADAGQLVLCGLTSAELGQAHGHVSVVVSGPLVFSHINNNSYPTAYWGKLGGTGGKNQGLNYSFGTGSINRVTYAAFGF